MTGATEPQLTIQRRRIVIRRGAKSQTVNVCTAEGKVGKYDVTYRLQPIPRVEVGDLKALATLEALREWCEARKGDPSRLPELVQAKDVDSDWLTEACEAVERCLDSLVTEFIVKPYLHRVEHSLHLALFGRLQQEQVLNQEGALATGEVTQLLHKEWPETRPRSTDRPRGLFDLAVLAPPQLATATLDQFRSGRIEAPIVIEVGLDYGLKHLTQDRDKVLHSEVRAPYLLHLSRIAVKDQAETEALLCAPGDAIKTAYVHHMPGTASPRVKRALDPRIS